MKSTLLRTVAASGLLAALLGGCATIPQPTWNPVAYPAFSPLPPPPVYAARPAPDVPEAMQMEPPPAGNGGSSWSHDLAIGGAGAIAGTQMARHGWFGGEATGETGALAGEALEGAEGAAEAAEGAEALEGLGALIAEDWWLLAL